MDELYTAGELPEIEVKLLDWLRDWHLNFGYKRLRQNIINNLIAQELLKQSEVDYETEEEKISKPYYEKFETLRNDFYNDTLNIKDLDEYSNRITKYREDNDKLEQEMEEKAKLGRLLDKNPDIYPQVARLYNVWVTADKTKLNKYPSTIASIIFNSNNRRAHWSPVTNSAFNIDGLHDVIAELSHPIQLKYGERNRWYLYLADIPETIWEETFGDLKHYSNPDHYEYDTHQRVEPALQKYILYGTPTKYLPTKKIGGKLIPRKFKHGTRNT